MLGPMALTSKRAVAVVCSQCGSPLTVALLAAAPDRLFRYASDRQPVVEPGVAIVDPEPRTVWKSSPDKIRETVELCPAGSLVVNPDDLLPGGVVVTGNAVGCCGLDRMDGPNQACASCGQVLGTAQTDGWTPAEVRFLPAAIVYANEPPA
jgi:hypothetical protein